jgi:hypothetical protein
MRDAWQMEEVWTWRCDNEDNCEAGYLVAIRQRFGLNAVHNASKLS